jgi:hypothetical protein
MKPVKPRLEIGVRDDAMKDILARQKRRLSRSLREAYELDSGSKEFKSLMREKYRRGKTSRVHTAPCAAPKRHGMLRDTDPAFYRAMHKRLMSDPEVFSDFKKNVKESKDLEFTVLGKGANGVVGAICVPRAGHKCDGVARHNTVAIKLGYNKKSRLPDKSLDSSGRPLPIDRDELEATEVITKKLLETGVGLHAMEFLGAPRAEGRSSGPMLVGVLEPWKKSISTLADVLEDLSTVTFRDMVDILFQVIDVNMRLGAVLKGYRHNDGHDENYMLSGWDCRPKKYVVKDTGSKKVLTWVLPSPSIYVAAIDFGWTSFEGSRMYKRGVSAGTKSAGIDVKPNPYYDLVQILTLVFMAMQTTFAPSWAKYIVRFIWDVIPPSYMTLASRTPYDSPTIASQARMMNSRKERPAMPLVMLTHPLFDSIRTNRPPASIPKRDTFTVSVDFAEHGYLA